MEAQNTDVNQGPLMRLGELYDEKGLLQRLGLGEKTLQELESEGGLVPWVPSRKKFYWSDDVFQAMRELSRKKKKG